MRATESNFRGVRSASGILTANSPSSAVTRSARVKESSVPDSKSDSSGAGSMGLPATRLTISTILVCLSMICLALRGRSSDFVSRLLVRVELLHEIAEHGGGEAAVTGHGEVHEVPLRQAGVDPVAHGALAAHAFAGVPESAGVCPAGGLLGFDDVVDAGNHLPFPLRVAPAVGGADHQDGGRGRGAAQ